MSAKCVGSPKASFCLSNDGSVWATGEIQHESVSTTRKFVKLPLLFTVSSISLNNTAAIISDTDGNVWVLGDRLGGTQSNKQFEQVENLSKIINVASGANHTICLDSDGFIYAFGKGDKGQLGAGEKCLESFEPTKISTVSNVTNIACGAYYTIVMDNSNQLFGTGENQHNQIGLPTFGSKVFEFTELNLAPIKDTIIQFDCGWNHSLFLTSNNKVFGVGYNYFGELGLDNKTETVVTEITEISALSNKTIISISCGFHRSSCIDENKNLWQFGCGYGGRLGFGDTANKITPTLVPDLDCVENVSHGGYHTIIKTSNKVFACGEFKQGILGIGDPDSSKIKQNPVRFGNTLNITTPMPLDDEYSEIIAVSTHTTAKSARK